MLCILLPLSCSYDYKLMHFENSYCSFLCELPSCAFRVTSSLSKFYLLLSWIAWLFSSCCFATFSSFFSLTISLSIWFIFCSISPTMLCSLLSWFLTIYSYDFTFINSAYFSFDSYLALCCMLAIYFLSNSCKFSFLTFS